MDGVSDDQPTPPGTPDGTPKSDHTPLVPADAGATQAMTPIADPPSTAPTGVRAPAVVPEGMAPADAAATSVLRPQAPDSQDPTAVVPASPDGPGQAPRWTGQAGVRPVSPDQDATGQWTGREPRRAWWLPIVVGIIGLLVLVGVAFALVIAMRNGSTPAPSSTTTLSPSPTPSPSEVPTTPTSSPSDTDTAGLVVVPTSLNGLFLSDAETLLSQLGLNYTEVPQISATALPNTVIGTMPDAGTSVPVGSTVVLIYAQAPAPSTPETPSTPESPVASTS